MVDVILDEKEKKIAERKETLLKKVSVLNEKIKKIDEEGKKLKTQKSKTEQKKDTRKSLVYGEFVMQNEEIREIINKNENFDLFLKRNADRKLFGFSPITKTSDISDKTHETDISNTEIKTATDETVTNEKQEIQQ
ncbi:hypothetical protein FACS1894187_02650 [Synergistales bacterium]|nr:hypothetical protein FACS1894187_02650 [Synergistales bacterium]